MSAPAGKKLPRPHTSAINPEQIPAELRECPRWIAWDWRWDKGRAQWVKVPVHPTTGQATDGTDPAKALPFEKALPHVTHHTPGSTTHGFPGLGFVIAPPYIVVDLDDCRDPSTGAVASWAQAIVDRLASYTETSPSGTGLHIICRGSLPFDGRRHGSVEAYAAKRYMTVTGHPVVGENAAQNEINERTAALAAFVAEHLPERVSPAKVGVPGTSPLSDDEVLAKAPLRTVSGPKFAALWAGDWASLEDDERDGQRFPSQSEADYALCRELAYWTGRDPEQMDRLFRKSGLMRDKWDRAENGHGSYGERTITAAIEATESVYTPEESTSVKWITVNRVGNDFLFTWSGVEIALTELRERDGIRGEITVKINGGVSHWSALNLASVRDVTEVVKALNQIDRAYPWALYLAAIVAYVPQEYRRGEPFTKAKPRRYTKPRFLVSPVVPAEGIVVFYADGGSGKGYLMLYVALAATENMILGGGQLRPSHPTRVLYLDWESNKETFEHRLWIIQTGAPEITMTEPIHYRNMTRPLIGDLGAIVAYITEHQIGLVLIDSMAPAMGGDPSLPEVAIPFMASLNELGVPVAAIAHVSKSDAAGKRGKARPFGSVFNSNLARATWEVVTDEERSDEETRTVTLAQRKVNEGRKQAPIGLQLVFKDGPDGHAESVQLQRAEPMNVRSGEDTLTNKDHISAHLVDRAPQTVKEISEALHLSPDVTRKTLNRLKEDGIVSSSTEGYSDGGARWSLK